MTVEVRAAPIDSAHGALLVERVQSEYVDRYGERDRTVMTAAEFAPPRGLFLIAYRDAHPVGCGGIRTTEPGVFDIKRMYVEPSARGLGIARRLLDELEVGAARLGGRRIRLETGDKQPEAVSLYRSSGYASIPGFGVYACESGNLCFGKDVGQPSS